MSVSPGRPGSRPWLATLLLAVGVAAVYLPSLGNGFIHDDHDVIAVQPQQRLAEALVRAATEPHFQGLAYYRPVTRSTFLLQRALHGAEPAPFRLVNAALMGVAAVLAAVVLVGLGVARGPALLAAALFGVHPLASACVYPVASGRETLLPAVLVLLAVAAWLRARQTLAWAAFALALFAKEQAVVVPLLFAGIDALGLGPRGAADRARLRTLLVRYAPVLPIVGTYALVRWRLFGGSEFDLVVLAWPLGPLLSLAYGLQSAVAPFAGLVYEPELAVWLSPWRLALATAVVGGLAVVAWRLEAPPRRVQAFWLGWFVVTQLPTANLLAQEAHFAERYAFLALLAPLGVAAGLASEPWPRAAQRAGLAAALAALALAAGTTLGRAAAYADDVTFARRWLATNPDSPDAHHLLAARLLRDGAADEALAHLRAALARSPDSADLHHNLGTALAMLGREAEARAALREALARDPAHPEALVNLGQLLGRAGRSDEALAVLREAVRVAPDSAGAHNSLGALLARRGALDEAEQHFGASTRLRPDQVAAWRNLGLLYLQRREPGAATAAFRRALRADPTDPVAHQRLRELEGPAAVP